MKPNVKNIKAEVNTNTTANINAINAVFLLERDLLLTSGPFTGAA